MGEMGIGSELMCSFVEGLYELGGELSPLELYHGVSFTCKGVATDSTFQLKHTMQAPTMALQERSFLVCWRHNLHACKVKDDNHNSHNKYLLHSFAALIFSTTRRVQMY